MKEKLKQWIPSKRKLMQLYFALLFNANLKGFVTGQIYKGNTKAMCAPGINCYSCPGAVGACPLGSLQGSFSADKSTLYYVGGILLLYCILFGRMICGWLCPFGFIQDLLHKIKTPKLKKGPVTRILSLLKYAILVFFVGIVPITYALRNVPLPAFCKFICPAGTLEGGLALLANKANDSFFSMLGPLFTWKFLLMVAILVGCVFVFRLFCRFLCPLGALYGLFNRISLFGVKVNADKCTDCGLCISKCKLDIKSVGDRECVSCGECVDVCPTKAIVWKGTSVFVRKNEGEPTVAPSSGKRTVTRAIATVAMLAVLAGVIGYYWVTAPDAVAVGTAVGDKCFGYDLPIVTADGIQTDTIDPTKTGRVTVVNFWGTWCSGCVAELPYFDQIATDYPEVTVVAVHTNMLVETAADYIGQKYPATKMVFAHDFPLEEGAMEELYYTKLGGNGGAYPYTVVLDQYGIIQSIFYSSVHYEDLQQAVEPLL